MYVARNQIICTVNPYYFKIELVANIADVVAKWWDLYDDDSERVY